MHLLRRIKGWRCENIKIMAEGLFTIPHLAYVARHNQSQKKASPGFYWSTSKLQEELAPL
jgi:hypothetical protein